MSLKCGKVIGSMATRCSIGLLSTPAYRSRPTETCSLRPRNAREAKMPGNRNYSLRSVNTAWRNGDPVVQAVNTRLDRSHDGLRAATTCQCDRHANIAGQLVSCRHSSSPTGCCGKETEHSTNVVMCAMFTSRNYCLRGRARPIGLLRYRRTRQHAVHGSTRRHTFLGITVEAGALALSDYFEINGLVTNTPFTD